MCGGVEDEDEDEVEVEVGEVAQVEMAFLGRASEMRLNIRQPRLS